MKKKISWFIDHFEEVFCVIFMTIMVLSLLLQVYFRYIVGKSLPWTEEISRYAFLFLVYFATILSAKNKTHIRVTAQFKALPLKIRKIIMIISDSIWIAFNCVVIYKGIEVFISLDKQISPSLGWNIKYVFLIVPIAFILMTLRMLQNYYQDYVKTRNEGGDLNAN